MVRPKSLAGGKGAAFRYDRAIFPIRPYWPELHGGHGGPMNTLTAIDAMHGFSRLIDLARAEPVAAKCIGAASSR